MKSNFILDGRIAIEVKGKEQISKRDQKGIRALQEEGLMERYIVVGMHERKRVEDGIEITPWQDFFTSYGMLAYNFLDTYELA